LTFNILIISNIQRSLLFTILSIILRKCEVRAIGLYDVGNDGFLPDSNGYSDEKRGGSSILQKVCIVVVYAFFVIVCCIKCTL